MRYANVSLLWLLPALSLGFLGLVFSVISLPALGQSQSQLLPAPPALDLPFTGPDERFPPQVRDMTEVVTVEWRDLPYSLTDDSLAFVRAIAMGDPRVIDALGDRFAFITASEVEENKDTQPPNRLIADLTYFSYTNNRPFVIRVDGERVTSVSSLEDYQPPEGQEEIALAIQLARADDRITNAVADLTSNAILFFGPNERTDHRILYVSFYQDEDQDDTLYFAQVDLNDQLVINAGPTDGT